MSQISEFDLNKYREAFSLFDADNDGAVSVNEVKEIFNNLGYNPSKKELQRMMHSIDNGKEGLMSFERFAQIMSKKTEKADYEGELKACFQLFDKDGDGFVTQEELYETLNKLGFHFTEKQVSDMMQFADEDGNGLLNYDEFAKVNSTLSGVK